MSAPSRRLLRVDARAQLALFAVEPVVFQNDVLYGEGIGAAQGQRLHTRFETTQTSIEEDGLIFVDERPVHGPETGGFVLEVEVNGLLRKSSEIVDIVNAGRFDVSGARTGLAVRDDVANADDALQVTIDDDWPMLMANTSGGGTFQIWNW